MRRIGDEACDCAAPLAVLFETARDNVRAAHFWNRAAQAAARLLRARRDRAARPARSGSPGAGTRQHRRGPEAELDLQITYGAGAEDRPRLCRPGGRRARTRGRARCAARCRIPRASSRSSSASSAHHIVAGEITTSRDVALEMLQLFDRLGDPNLQMMGNWSLGAALFHLGDLRGRRTRT